jgi:ubiquinone/menaquinone biosynthesis C-methylase UbiE
MNDRVEREKYASDVDNVLAASYALKHRFSHCELSSTMKRMEWTFRTILCEVSGKRVLEIGCGEGETALMLLRGGATVFGIDIGEKYVNTAKGRVVEEGPFAQSCELRVMDAHKLEFPDNSFDLVVGRGVLHHLDLERALAEIQRVLVPGGHACFIEPLANNPLLKLFRKLTPKARTIDERPLDGNDLRLVASKFSTSHEFYGLISAPLAIGTSILLRPWPNNFILRWADKIERVINRIKRVQSWNQYVLIRAEKV